MHDTSFSTLFLPEIQLALWKLPGITWEGIPSSGFFFWASMKGWENAHALCLSASFIVSLFIIPFPVNESRTMTLHAAPTRFVLWSFMAIIAKKDHNTNLPTTWLYQSLWFEKVSEIDSGKIEGCQLLQHNMDLLMFFLHWIWFV